ncbi:hypothetical protein MGMO_153c00130 [Methyloglobulus morosus KoM1]|uniref:Uncharacterized protein n=1 Tax=Methyloglobulus morosus KoM1 TaxID=1116472 RepID=V5BPM8_9GAMM|nr:hypothetical protein MGMO_153c00130 [Methyloglobulus morosus KoM1]
MTVMMIIVPTIVNNTINSPIRCASLGSMLNAVPTTLPTYKQPLTCHVGNRIERAHSNSTCQLLAQEPSNLPQNPFLVEAAEG